jgi:GH25 family lysozyme M1 (1,4-beta-N-acetylmuramidase)
VPDDTDGTEADGADDRTDGIDGATDVDPGDDATDPDINANPNPDAETDDGAQLDEDELSPENGAPVFAALAAPDLSGIYTIGSLLPGSKTLDIAGASRENGAWAQIYGSNTTPAQRFRLERQTDGSYIIVNVNSGKVLDVRQGQAQSGTAVWQYTLNYTAAQKWDVIPTDDSGSNSYYLRSKLGTELYLDVKNASSANGTRLHIYQGNKTDAQKFSLNRIEPIVADGYYIIHTVSSDKVLDVAGAGTANNANLQIYQSNYTFAQRFWVRFDANTGYYTITNVNAMKPLDVAGGRTVNGTNVAIYAANNTEAQRWTIVEDGQQGVYRLYSACSGLVLDVAGGRTVNGTNVHTYASNGTNAQKWTFEATTFVADGGVVTIQSALGTVLDAVDGGTADGTNIQAYTANGTQAQKFRVTAVGGDYYQIECLNSGMVLSLSGTNVVLSAPVNAAAQRWKILPANTGGGYFLLENGTGKVLDIAGGSKSAGANAQVYAHNDTAAQKWRLNATVVISEGIYVLVSALDTGKALNIADASQVDGAALQLDVANGTLAQKFSFVRNANGSYRIVPLSSSKPIEVKDGSIDQTNGQGSVWQWPWRGADSPDVRQDWHVEYTGDGSYRVLSLLGDGTSCLEVNGSATADGTEIIVARRSGSSAQLFKLTNFISNSSYVPAPLDGIDVSSHQPSDIGNRVNYDFMIVKATGGTTYTNPYYVTQASSALARGKKLGLYHYAGEYGDQNNAIAEAWHFVDAIRGYVGRAALFLDYEEDVLGDDREWVKTFCNEVYRLTGVKCGIYTSGSWAQNKIPNLWNELDVVLWQANWPDGNQERVGYTHQYTPMVPCNIHQYTSRGKLIGYSGNLDLSVCFGSSATWDYWASRR